MLKGPRIASNLDIYERKGPLSQIEIDPLSLLRDLIQKAHSAHEERIKIEKGPFHFIEPHPKALFMPWLCYNNTVTGPGPHLNWSAIKLGGMWRKNLYKIFYYTWAGSEFFIRVVAVSMELSLVEESNEFLTCP